MVDNVEEYVDDIQEKELYDEFVQFRDEWRKTKKEYANESWKDYQTHVHALKSTSLNIGAEKLSEHAKALEYAAKDENYQYIRKHHDEVMKEYGELLTELGASK